MNSSRKRLDELHVHALGQAADIVVALDRHRRAAGEADAFDDVGVERALGEEVRAAELLGFLLEHGDEFAADELALGLGVGDPGEAGEEALLGIHDDERDVVMVAEQALDLLALVEPQQAVVDEHAGQLRADRFVDEDRRDRAVDPARQAADDLAVADLGADVGDLGVAIARHRPVAGHPADAVDEVGEQLRAVGGVDDLGVELGAVIAPRLVGDDREGRAVAGRDDLEARGRRR